MVMNSPGGVSGIQYQTMSKAKTNKVPKSTQQKKDKVTNAPVSVGTVTRSAVPKVNGSNSIRIARREYVGAVVAPATGFNLTAVSTQAYGYDFNPSCSSLFPWLSKIAPCYERFRFNKLAFKLVSRMPTSTFGSMYMAVDYDFDDEVPTDATTMLGNITAIGSNIWQNVELVCDPKSLNRDMPYRFINASGRSVVDNRTAFAGYLMIAILVNALPANIELWVEYDVELVTPCLDVLIHQEVPYASTFPAATAVVPAHGAGFYNKIPLANGTMTAGPCKVVVPGSNGVPVLNTVLGGVQMAYDLAMRIPPQYRAGIIKLLVKYLVTGVTPSTILGGNTTVVHQVFDAAGTYLSNLTTIGAVPLSGPTTPADIATAGHTVQHKTDIDLDSLLYNLPTAAYIASHITSGGALGAGNLGLYPSFST